MGGRRWAVGGGRWVTDGGQWASVVCRRSFLDADNHRLRVTKHGRAADRDGPPTAGVSVCTRLAAPSTRYSAPYDPLPARCDPGLPRWPPLPYWAAAEMMPPRAATGGRGRYLPRAVVAPPRRYTAAASAAAGG